MPATDLLAISASAHSRWGGRFTPLPTSARRRPSTNGNSMRPT